MRFKKAKNAYIYDTNSVKYYDFRDNSNIIGFADKKLTTYIKDRVSSWFIYDSTVHHDRMTVLCRKLFGDSYSLFSAYSLEEFFSRLFLSFSDTHQINIIGKNFNSWLAWKHIRSLKTSSTEKITACDVNEFLFASHGDTDLLKELILSVKKDGIFIQNCYWYPLPDITSAGSDMIILPKSFCGNFSHILLLVRKDLKDFAKIVNPLKSVDSFSISVSLKNFYMIKQLLEKRGTFSLNWPGVDVTDRLFVPKDLSHIEEISHKLFEKKIIINTDPPYYNYLPVNLEEYQKKYLRKAFL